MGQYPSRAPWMWGTGAALLASVMASVASASGNLVQDPQDLEKWGTFRNASVVPNVIAAPDGSLTADRVNESPSENGARIFSNTVIAADGGSFVYTVYLKAGNISQARITIANGAGTSVRGFLQTGITADWKRYEVKVSAVPVGEPLRVEIYPGKFDRDPNGFIYAWGAQLERGTTPSPYSGTGGDGGTSPEPPADTTPPATPSGLTGQFSSSGLRLTWNANSETDLAGYRLERSTDGVNYSALASPTTPSYTDSPLTAGVTYRYRVAAVDQTGNLSGFSGVYTYSVAVADNPPAAPTGLTAVLNGTAVQVSWNANSEADLNGYRLERGVNSTSSFSLLASPAQPSHSDSGVLAGNTYSYRVCAVDAAGQLSAPSSVVSVQVPLPSTGALNVLQFGANPATGGDDTAAIQAAFNAAQQQGKDVYFPAGHYWLSREVIFRAHGRTVYGDGSTQSILAGNTGSYSLLELERTRDVTVRDLRFEGSHVNTSDTANTGKAVVNNGTLRTRIQRIHSYGTGYIAFDNGGTYSTLEDSVCEDYGRIGYLIATGGTVRRCRFVNRPGWRFTSEMQGIYASAGRKDITIEDNEFTNVGIYAIQLWGSQNGVWTENITIQRNVFRNCPRVLVVAAGDSGPLYRNVRFLGNTVEGVTEKAMQIGKFNGSTSQGTELLIEGNVFADAGPTWGIYMTPWGGAALTGIRIRNNVFRAPQRSSYHGAVNVSGASDVIIEGNEFHDIGHDGTTEIISAGVQLQSGSNVVVRDNTFSHWPTAGTSRVVNGVKLESNIRNALVQDNLFLGNGRTSCFGINMVGSGSSIHGSITGNVLRSAKFQPNGIPNSNNTVQ